jgi:hypothetical protein
MNAGNVMSQSSIKLYLKGIHPRYQKLHATEKQHILDEFCANCSLSPQARDSPVEWSDAFRPQRRQGRREPTYDTQVITILKAVWEATDYPWSAPLKAQLPDWMPWIRSRFRLTLELEGQLLAISVCTIDRRLHPHKRRLGRRLYGRTRPGTFLKHHIPLKTDHGV